ncbi:hypothetical protein [uncultured Sphingomonas sp.]|uniref:hypothetical protein n=1 Tax=uncultured Sphingomonas sp. TaxID=158754 RepID=UPI0035C9B1EA
MVEHFFARSVGIGFGGADQHIQIEGQIIDVDALRQLSDQGDERFARGFHVDGDERELDGSAPGPPDLAAVEFGRDPVGDMREHAVREPGADIAAQGREPVDLEDGDEPARGGRELRQGRDTEAIEPGRRDRTNASIRADAREDRASDEHGKEQEEIHTAT